MSPRRSRLDLGEAGEAAAAEWYRAAGYGILARNWRCRDGELDIIAHRAGTLVFCEVKTRSSAAFGFPAEAVGSAKQRRLRALAGRWLAEADPGQRPYASEMRFDVASVSPGPRGFVVEVIEAAF